MTTKTYEEAKAGLAIPKPVAQHQTRTIGVPPPQSSKQESGNDSKKETSK